YFCLDHFDCKPDSCGPLAQCDTNGGCVCVSGYEIPPPHKPTPDSYGCSDIDECQRTSGICGPDSNCTNTIGSYVCACLVGYNATDPASPPGKSNPCTDIDECEEDLCGDGGTCLNNPGSFKCNCLKGYELVLDATPLCKDIDECFNSTICGPDSICTNTPGAHTCECKVGFTPTDPAESTSETNICIDIDECDEDASVCGPNSNCTNSIGSYICTCFPGYRLNTPNVIASVANPCSGVCPCLVFVLHTIMSAEVSSVGPRARSSRVGSEGDGETGTVILGITDLLVSTLVQPGQNSTRTELQTPSVDLSLQTIGPDGNDDNTPLSAQGLTMDINLQALASANNGSAAAAFVVLPGMESLLSHQYFKTENQTEMNSDVFTAVIPSINTTNLTEPVNFTIQHKKPPPEDPFLEWLNRMCVIVGLFFFALAIFTFLLCSWNPKINNTARLHLCLSLFLSHLLLLWNDEYTEQELACTVMAGLLHFLVLAGFVWMLLEAIQLHLLVRRLNKVQVIQRDGLPRPLLYLIGYGVPFVIVGVSALVYSDGYGATEAEVCWLSRQRNFNWALTGPVIAILGMNWILFCATLWSLRATLISMKSGASQSKDSRVILFKIVAQFVILGCTWILGLYQSNLFFQILFIVLNSQQGTFLFIVHCLLNKEVRDEYIRWLTCSIGKDRSVVSP
ncbi:adhesion G protein-coupled receptor E1-like, partial [Centropristis striata]|uniref:adhesion G protein-coupled receptor E1-like n=1 Tax=Centropristis striata TaxID=184440 RepID=UPI0027E17163